MKYKKPGSIKEPMTRNCFLRTMRQMGSKEDSTVTVQSLIAELQKAPPDTQVRTYQKDGDLHEIKQVEYNLADYAFPLIILNTDADEQKSLYDNKDE